MSAAVSEGDGCANVGLATVVRGRRTRRVPSGDCCCIVTTPVQMPLPTPPSSSQQMTASATTLPPSSPRTSVSQQTSTCSTSRLLKRPSGLMLLRRKKSKFFSSVSPTFFSRVARAAAASCSRCRSCKPASPTGSSASVKIKESNMTKCIYTLMLAVATALMSAMLVPTVQHQLRLVFRDFSATCRDLDVERGCLKLTGYLAAFKVSFCFACVFLLLCLVTAGVTSSRSARAAIHNGFWALKALLVLALLVAAFVVPVSHAGQVHTAWIYTCLVGNWIFIILQLVCIIDFSDTVRASLCRLTNRRQQLVRQSVELCLAVTVVSLWLVISVSLFLIHGRQEFCLTKQLALIANTGLSIAIMLSSITPCARRSGGLPAPPHDGSVPYSGASPPPLSSRPPFPSQVSLPTPRAPAYSVQLFQSGLVVVYMTYWVWSAMQSTPESPGFVELYFIVEESDLVCYMPRSFLVESSLTYSSVVMMLFTLAYISSSYSEVKRNKRRRMAGMKVGRKKANVEVEDNNANAVTEQFKLRQLAPSTSNASLQVNIGNGGNCLLLLPPYAPGPVSVSHPPPPPPPPPPSPPPPPPSSPPFVRRPHHLPLPTSSSPRLNSPRDCNMSPESKSQLNYSYSLFHMILFVAVAHVTTQLTGWYQPYNYALPDIDRSWQTVGLKVACAWSCGFAYLGYLLVPTKCFSRICCRSNTGGITDEVDEEDGEDTLRRRYQSEGGSTTHDSHI